jgi:DNA polymerase-3 subunit epsilon
MRERFLGVVRDEAQHEPRIKELAAQSARAKTRWPLEDMLGADLVQARRSCASRR